MKLCIHVRRGYRVSLVPASARVQSPTLKVAFDVIAWASLIVNTTAYIATL